MTFDLASLGFTKEELQQRVIDGCVQRVFDTAGCDEDGDEITFASPLARRLETAIKSAIDTKVSELAEAHVLPKVGAMLENIVLQQTNQWGEKRGEPVTLVEYLTQRADAYLREDVNYEGKDKASCGSYSFTKAQSRITHLVHQHLHYRIESAMKDAVNVVNAAIVPALADTAKLKLEEIAKNLKVQVGAK